MYVHKRFPLPDRMILRSLAARYGGHDERPGVFHDFPEDGKRVPALINLGGEKTTPAFFITCCWSLAVGHWTAYYRFMPMYGRMMPDEFFISGP